MSVRGFSLIELMIVVAIIAILASLAYYNYGRYAFRTRRADGREMLMRVAAAQERFYTNTNGYTLDVVNGPPGGLGLGATSPGGHYTIGVTWGTSGDPNSFIASAIPTVGDVQAADLCGTLTIDNVGNKGANSPGDNSNGSCW
jgi:type IV pilus assembly protein PilE